MNLLNRYNTLLTGSRATTQGDLARPLNIRLGRVLQALLFTLGIGAIVWAFADSSFRDAEGFLEASFIVPVAVGMALLVMSWAVVRRWVRFSLWFGLALVGQALALQLIEAGSAVGYQHYKPFDRLLLESHPALLGYLALQALAVTAGLVLHWRKIWEWTRRTFKLWQVIAMAIVFYLTSAALSPDVPVYIGELLFASFVQTVSLLNIVLAAWSVPTTALASLKQRLDRLFGLPGEEDASNLGGLDRFALLAAVWVIVVAAVLNVFSYQQHPHVPDEVAYLYHARYFAQGALTLPAPLVPDAFEIYLMQVSGDVWYPSPPPGWPLPLAVGVLLGIPWLVNPVLAGINILLAYLLLKELYSRRTARIAILLLAVSPWHIFLGMSFMTHQFTLTGALFAALGVAWSRRIGKTRWAWMAGISLGVMALIRPMEAAAIAIVLGLWAIGIGGQRLKVQAIAGLVIGSIIVGGLVFPYNKALTGDPMLFPIMQHTDQFFGPNSNALGFGPDRGMGWELDPYPGHSPRDGVINANLNASAINIELFGWSIGSLLIAAVMVFAGKLRRSDYLMLAVMVAIFVPHFFYYFSGGPDFGGRYWFLMIVPLVVLTARGIQFLERSLSQPNKSAVVLAAVMALSFMTLVTFVPWRAVDKYHNYRGMRPDIRYLAKEHDFGRSLVFVRGNRHPDYASAAAYNPLDLKADAPVYVWDRTPELTAQVLEAYPDRPVWLVNGPILTQSGYEVVEGPMTASDFLARHRHEAQ
jgi:hypothetical protein